MEPMESAKRAALAHILGTLHEDEARFEDAMRWSADAHASPECPEDLRTYALVLHALAASSLGQLRMDPALVAMAHVLHAEAAKRAPGLPPLPAPQFTATVRVARNSRASLLPARP